MGAMADGEIIKWDARCQACEDVHIAAASAAHDAGDVIRTAHNTGRKACGEYGEHELIAPLRGLA